MRKCPLSVAALVAVCGLVSAAELQSGLPKGEFVPAFIVCDVTGPSVIAFGAGGEFSYASASSDTGCNDTIFVDPAAAWPSGATSRPQHRPHQGGSSARRRTGRARSAA